MLILYKHIWVKTIKPRAALWSISYNGRIDGEDFGNKVCLPQEFFSPGVFDPAERNWGT